MKRGAERKSGLKSLLFRRVLHTYFLMQRGLTLGVRAIVRLDNGKFLLVRHTYTSGWHFPGGGVEKGETIEQALSNELLQEAGLQLARKPVLHGVFYNDVVSQRDHVFVYLCEIKDNADAKRAGMEIAKIGYFDYENLPLYTDPGTVRRIYEVVHGAAKTETW